MVWFSGKWEQGLGKTRKGLLERITQVFRGRDRLDEGLLNHLEQILIESDVGVEITRKIVEEVKEVGSAGGGTIEQEVRSILKKRMLSLLMDGEKTHSTDFKQKPHVILVAGVNGTGKTTTIGKLAYRFRQEGKKVLLAAADTFRAAAGEQLEIWGCRVGADVVKQHSGADAASVAYDALDAACARNVDVLIVDTAGRLHTKINLMEELKKISRVLSKRMPGAPHEVLLIIDATTGQNGLRQAEIFAGTVGVTGMILTKLDGTARGGIVVAVKQNLSIPVEWVGVGEGMEDLIPFDAEKFVEGMLGEDG